MIQKRLALTSLAVIAVMAVLHAAANAFFWYVSIPWYDMMMHTLGGVFLALFTGAFFHRHVKDLDWYETSVTLLLAVLIIGIGWECFEYAVQYLIKGSTQLADVSDSVSDLVCDMFGGIIGTFFVLRLKKRYNTRNG